MDLYNSLASKGQENKRPPSVGGSSKGAVLKPSTAQAVLAAGQQLEELRVQVMQQAMAVRKQRLDNMAAF
jgi:hypothetical protein